MVCKLKISYHMLSCKLGRDHFWPLSLFPRPPVFQVALLENYYINTIEERREAKVKGDDIKVSNLGASKYHRQKLMSQEEDWQ